MDFVVDWENAGTAQLAVHCKDCVWQSLAKLRCDFGFMGIHQLIIKNVGELALLRLVIQLTPPPTAATAVPMKLTRLVLHNSCRPLFDDDERQHPLKLEREDFVALSDCLKSPACTIEQLVMDVTGSEEDAQLLLEGYTGNKSLRSVKLNNSEAKSPLLLRRLLAVLETHSQLRRLIVCNVEEIGRAFSGIVCAAPLKALTILHCSGGKGGGLADFCRTLETMTRLQRFEVRPCFNDETARPLWQSRHGGRFSLHRNPSPRESMLWSSLTHAPKRKYQSAAFESLLSLVREMQFHLDDLGELKNRRVATESVNSTLREMPAVSLLELDVSRLRAAESQAVFNLLGRLTNLQTLSLNCKGTEWFEGGAGGVVLGDLLHLHLDYLDHAGAAYFAGNFAVQFCPKLESLAVIGARDKGIDDEGVKRLLAGLPGSLIELELSRCLVGHEGMAVIGRLAARHDSKLKRISFNGNEGIASGGVQAMSHEMTRPTCVDELEFLQCQLQPSDATALSGMISTSLQQLRKLNLAFNKDIGNAGFAAMAETLLQSHNLEVLSLDCCGLGDDSSPRLERILAKLQRLKIVSLDGNYYGMEGARRVANGAAGSVSLVEFGLPWHDDHEASTAAIHRYLDANRTLGEWRKIQGGNFILHHLVLAKLMGHPKAVFELLRTSDLGALAL